MLASGFQQHRAIRQDTVAHNSIDTSHRMATLPVGGLTGPGLITVQRWANRTSTRDPDNERIGDCPSQPVRQPVSLSGPTCKMQPPVGPI